MKARALLALMFSIGTVIITAPACSALEGLTGGDDDGSLPLPNDPPAPACSAATAPKCEHGKCVEQNAVAACACETSWTGPTCSDCAIGASCGTRSCADTKCAAHSTCIEGGSPTCKCVVGYVQNGKDCAWLGVVQDPAFQNEPIGSWKLAGGVTINPTAPGVKEPGTAELKTASCTTASVSQSFTMPSYETAEPFALEIYGKGKCEVSFFGTLTIPCIKPLLVNVSGGGIEPVSVWSGEAPPPNKTCLGDRAYGGTISLAIAPSSCVSTTKSTLLDHVDIIPAPDCPIPGQVFNADFEGNGGWVVGGTGAEVAPNVGNKSSRGGRLHVTKRCDQPRLTGALSVKLKDSKPALTFTMKGTQNRRMRVYMGTYLIGTFTGTAVYEQATLCLPEQLKGMASPLAFALEDDKTDGVCGDPDELEFIIDDVRIGTDDASCEDGALVIDGGFEGENKSVSRYWGRAESGGTVSFIRGGAAGANGAHAGLGYAIITQSTCSKSTSMRTTVTIPPAIAGSGGPAIEYFYKAPAATAVSYSGPTATPLTAATVWTRALKCIDPRRAGFPQNIDFTVNAAANCATGSLTIDDVRVIHDPTCPE